MLGAYRDRMPVYSMCGWYYDSDDDLSMYRRSITTAMEQGYRADRRQNGVRHRDRYRSRHADAFQRLEVQTVADAQTGDCRSEEKQPGGRRHRLSA